MADMPPDMSAPTERHTSELKFDSLQDRGCQYTETNWSNFRKEFGAVGCIIRHIMSSRRLLGNLRVYLAELFLLVSAVSGCQKASGQPEKRPVVRIAQAQGRFMSSFVSALAKTL